MRNVGRGRLLVVVPIASFLVLSPGLATRACASMLLAPGVGAPDQATDASFVAEPLTPDSALFENPAGLVRFERTTLTFSTGIIQGNLEVKSREAGYDRNDQRYIFVPSGGMSTPLAPGWRAGMGFYGTVGTTFDFEAQPPNVNSDFVTEVAIGSAPFALAREITPKFWVGAEVIGLFGYLRNRYTLLDPFGGPLPIKYTIRGPGLQAMLGLTWKPDDAWSLGMSLVSPGKVWMDGSTVLAGRRTDVDLDLKMPMILWLGVTRHFGKRADVSLSYRWVDASVFSRSDIEYASVKVTFVPDAHDEWRIALGGTYHLTEALTLLAGTSYASRIVGNNGISPLLFDGEHVGISAGVSYAFGTLVLHTMVGYGVEFSRKVSSNEARILPGEYKGGGPIVMLGTTYEM